jgi:DNA modification methylase
MNKLRGEHDIKLDADEIALIFQSDKLGNLAELIAQQQETLENILTKHKGIQFQHEDGFDVDKALEDLVPETKLGDIWQLGNHKIICADCSDERSIKRLMEDKKADLVLTDPPYNVSENMQGDYYENTNFDNMKKLEKTDWDQQFDIKPMLDSIFPVLADDCTVYIFTSQYLAPVIWNWMKDWAKFYSYLVYCKPDPMPSLSKRYWTWATELICFATRGKHIFNYNEGVHNPNYLIYSRTEAAANDHPTKKPVRLLSEIIKHSSKEDSIVFDPFLGSGSTLIACEQTNRICRGVEIDPHYVDVCVKRYEAYTNNKATKVQEVI